MKYIIVISALLILAVCLMAQPAIEPTPFLNALPDKMCQDYIDQHYGQMYRAFVQPTGGALARIDMVGVYYCMYFFCDKPLNRLMIFRLFDDGVTRTPQSVKEYGYYVPNPWFTVVHEDSLIPDSLSPPVANRDSIGCFDSPVDIAVSSCGRDFKPDEDYIYVLDQGNRRVVKLKYDVGSDTLIWMDYFGEDVLRLPTSLDYAAYGDTDPGNDDIYVTDGVLSKIFRFSTDGDYEESYGGFGSNMALIGYPTGIAVSTDPELPNRFYISDSRNHRVSRYYSASDGPIMVEWQYTFPHFLSPPPCRVPLLIAVDTDSKGYVYVVDKFSHMISILASDLSTRLKDYGEFGFDKGQFNYPLDIYIDSYPGSDEMNVCETWEAQAGIQSFKITEGLGKRGESENLPLRFNLYQNYPNPFNSVTTIKFDLPKSGHVKMVIYNILGQKVITAIDDDMPAGRHAIIWNSENESGDEVASGIYLYKIETDDHRDTKKLVLLK